MTDSTDSKKNKFTPGWALFIFVAASVVLWTLQCSLTQTILPLDVIETIVWGGQGQLGHFRHPPMSGWVGYAFSCLSGHADWSMYLAAQLCIACGVYYVYRLAKEFFTDYEAAAAALLLYILHYYTPSSMKFCSHFIETAFMPAMAFYFYRGLKENHLLDWLLFGTASAIAFLSKYAAAQLFPACLLVMLWTPAGRKRFRSAGLYLSAILFLLLIAPHVYWLWQHDFCSVMHLQERVGDHKEPWHFPLQALATALYPIVAEGAVLLLASMPWRKNIQRKKISAEALHYSLIFTFVPAGIYLLIVLTGGNIILMWFSYLASFTGIAVVAASPWTVDKGVFVRVYAIIVIFTVGMFIGSTIDMLIKPRLRCHTTPEQFTKPALDYYKKKTGGKMPAVVYGERWEAGLLENYLPGRPKACVFDDPVNIELVRELANREGVLLIADNANILEPFFKAMGRSAKLEMEFKVYARAYSGKVKKYKYKLGYLPPLPSASAPKK